jgi:hypothetical protein
MDADSVLEVLALLDAASVEVWLDGGWGVDALLEAETRAHRDLDVISSVSDVPRLRGALAAAGFREKPGGTAGGFVLSDARGREVDVHAIRFDSRGCGVFALPDGRRWPFPQSAFAGRGRVGARSVRCLSAEAQVQCHGQGYAPAEKDLADMERLQERFGVVLPLALCRQALARGERANVLAELVAREPIFHRPELGTTRRDFEGMVEPDFWEVGASGRRYGRAEVLDLLEKRHQSPHEDPWETSDFECREIAPDDFLLTYTLRQNERVTRRSTLWRRRGGAWRIAYHQGTLVQDG